ncbi:DUF4179 domain-containing protein [Bacillus sp. REN3]|uniref:DUF4179 domain-containing protein n=1 Tax=Bacillus sp. REN3 TaxID=2802440 RepID=UPI001FEEE5B5|nr:DUF4179 domain-containing protein [Bacillus sp. REN3]
MPIREKGIESIINWFDQHKQSFYRLGWFYLRDQEQMEEFFYRTIIRVHKESPRYKSDASYETWVTSIFIDNCRELSGNKGFQHSEEKRDVSEALELLDHEEKEALLLTYVNGFSREEAAHILRVSEDKMKELIFCGIQSVRRQLSDINFNGCREYHLNYLDYLENSMPRPEKIEFEMHIYHCRECQEDLAAFQGVMLNLAEGMNDSDVPPYFLENVRKRLREKEEHRQQKDKKRKQTALVLAGVLAFFIGIGFFTGAFRYAFYSWTEEDEQLRAFLQNGLGERVNLEAESDGVKIKIKGVVADDIQTLVFYEIEDTKESNQFFMNFEDGLVVENESGIMDQDGLLQFYHPDLKAAMNKKDKNVFYGKVGLRPLKKDNGKITLEISKLVKLKQDASDSFGLDPGNIKYKTGEWKFEIPVTKQPSTEYALDEQTEIEGIPIRLEKLTVAPTATVLQYAIFIEKPEKRLDFVQFDDLVVNDKKVKTDWYDSGSADFSNGRGWDMFQTQFAPLYGEKPKEAKFRFASAYFTFENDKSIDLDVTKPYPQTFEYAGSTISIDKMEVGLPTTIILSDHEIENRKYETFHFNIVGENEDEPVPTEVDMEGVFVDRNGVKYNPMEDSINIGKIEQPRHFTTVQTIKLGGKEVIPKRLDIYEYKSMKYLDEVVEVKLE